MPPLTHPLTLTGQDRTLRLKSAGTGRDIVLIHGALTTPCRLAQVGLDAVIEKSSPSCNG